jgi:hypothetical protein
MDSATWGTYNEQLRVIKFVLDNKKFGLKVQTKLEKNLGWNLKVFVTLMAGDPETIVSVTSFITISWTYQSVGNLSPKQE